jgi:hypothetical protein
MKKILEPDSVILHGNLPSWSMEFPEQRMKSQSRSMEFPEQRIEPGGVYGNPSEPNRAGRVTIRYNRKPAVGGRVPAKHEYFRP